MIEIDGLNQRQLKFVEYLWSLETQDEIEQFIRSFGPKRQKECRTLIKLILFACIDNEVNDVTDEVKDLINRIRYK